MEIPRSGNGAPNEKLLVGCNWRFRVPAGEALEFADESFGPQRALAGIDFGDFVIWRKDDVPAYQLAVVVDDAEMGVTEVVRGADFSSPPFGNCFSIAHSVWRRRGSITCHSLGTR